MSATALARHLVRIGASAGLRAETGRIRLIALLCATAVLALGLLSSVVVHATYSGMRQRAWARGPQLVAPGQAAPEAWAQFPDWVYGHEFWVIQIEPLRVHAPLPPGLSRWPAPGQAVLSPALRRQGADEDITRRYGRVVGTIGSQGLINPGERLAYVRPSHRVTAAAGSSYMRISGYGSVIGEQVGEALNIGDRPEWMLQLLVWGLLVFPSLVLVFIAVRTGSHSRDRRIALLTVLGGRRRDRAMVNLGEAAPAVLAGALIAAAATVPAITSDFSLPYIGFTISAADIQADLPLLGLGPVAAAALVGATTVVADRAPMRRVNATRPVANTRPSKFWALACVVTLLAATRGPDLFFAHGSVGHLLTNYAGILGFLATLPATLALIGSTLGTQLARAGRATGRVSMILSGCRSASHPSAIGRLVAGVITAVVLLIQVQVWYGIMSDQVLAARAVDTRLGHGVVTANTYGHPAPRQISAFLHSLPSDSAGIALTVDNAHDTAGITGSCRALGYLQLPCRSTRVPTQGMATRTKALIVWNDPFLTQLSVRPGNPAARASAADGNSTLLLVAPQGRALPLDALRKSAFHTMPGGASIAPLGQLYVSPAMERQRQGRWIIAAGTIGVTVLALAMGIGAVSDFLRTSRALGPVSMLTGRRRVLYSTAAWSVLLPMTLGGGIAVVAGTWFAFPMTEGGYSYISGALLAACVATVTMIALILSIWGGGIAARESSRWRPGTE